MGRQSSFHKLFIFFGTDIERYGHKFLQESHSQGYTLLPLDSSAVGFTRGAKLPFGLIDEYVGLDALLRSRLEAAEFYRNWFKPAGSEFTSDDICWPEFDLEAMRWFWQDVAITFELAEAFQRRGGSQLQFFHQEVLRPSVFYYRNDIHAVILNQLFPNKALPVSIPEAKVKNSIDYFSRMRITFDDTSGRPLYNPDIFKDRIVLAFNPGESYRFGHVIEQLTREFPGEVAIMLIFPSSAHEKKLSEKYSIPVVSPRQLDFMEPEYQSRFFNGYNKLIQNTSGRLGWTINVLKYQFDNYCRYRWPAFVSNFHTWLNLWKRIRPKAVVVSALNDGESQLPAEAANRYDIPTFSIPHAAAFVIEKTSKVVSKYVLYSLGHQKTHFRKNGVAPDRLICCRNLRAINEHPVVVRESFGEKKNWRILALMNPTKIDSVINPTIEPSKQIEALKILDKPPADIAGQISLIVKVHPGFPELELVSSVSSSLTKKILPPDTDLQTVVEQVDLVVAVNYFGAALVQVLCSGKPVIFLTTDRLMKAIQSIDPNYNIYSLPSTFNTVGTGKELWDAVRRHFTDGQYAQQMRLQSRQFYQENLDDSKYPTIGRVIKEVLSKSQDKIINAETVECSVNSNQAVVKKCKIEQLLPHHDTIPVELLNYKYQPGIDGDGSVPPHELEVICKIVRYKKPHTILEFGTYEGDTTLRLGANSQAEIYTFDLPPEGYKDYTKPLVKDPELDVYPVTPGIKFHGTPWAHRIHQIFADTQTYDFSQFYGKFDVVFVDACHHYEFVLHDSINALKMIRPGGVIIWHDYAPYAPGVMQALNKISKKFLLLHIEGTSLAVYCSQQDIKAEDVEMTLFGNEEQSLCKQTTFQSEESKIKCSVIIPTYNRCGLLKKTIESLVHQDFPAGQYEILVVDNGSTDSTRQVAESAISAYQGHNIRYIFEPEPGLHCGRHRGAIESTGQILCYLDDDVVVDKLWLQGVIETFTNTDAVLVGGKILPKYETEPPEWINQFIVVRPEGKSLGQLSLIDFGNELKQIDPCLVWGCNYSIRKDVLFECGGFHPDSMPSDLIRYRGDGETALSAAIKEKGYRAYYNPKACVYHYIPKERLTVEYFCKRMFCQGISDSFTQIRKDGNIQNSITLKIRDAYNKGMAYHHEQFFSDPKLLDWILRDNYFACDSSKEEVSVVKQSAVKDYQADFDSNVKSFFAGVNKALTWIDSWPLSPKSAVIYITERCNSRCLTCTAWKNQQESVLDTKTWMNILRQVRQIGIESVEFSGGEPLLRTDLSELVRTARELGFSTRLVCTNGLAMNEQRLNDLVQSGVNSFHISLDGMRDTHRFIRGVDCYDKTINVIEMISAGRIPLVVLTTLVRQNIDDLESIVSIAAKYGAKWFLNLLENKKYFFRGVDIEPLLITEQIEIDRAIELLCSIKAKYPNTCLYDEAAIGYIRDYLEDPKRESGIPCTIGNKSIYFDSAGNLYSACMSLPPVGNGAQVPIKDLVNSPVMRQRLKAMIKRKCNGCTCGYSQRAAFCAEGDLVRK